MSSYFKMVPMREQLRPVDKLGKNEYYIAPSVLDDPTRTARPMQGKDGRVFLISAKLPERTRFTIKAAIKHAQTWDIKFHAINGDLSPIHDFCLEYRNNPFVMNREVTNLTLSTSDMSMLVSYTIVIGMKELNLKRHLKTMGY